MVSRSQRASVVIATLALFGSRGIEAQSAPSMVTYCAAGSAESQAAQASVRALGRAIEDTSVPMETIAERYAALRSTPCFASAGAGDAPLDSRVGLRVWWDEGGLDWLWHHASGRDAEPFQIVLPPDGRPSITLELTPTDHPVRALRCAEPDEDCGAETRGWVLRAEESFAAHAAADRERVRRVAEGADATDDAVSNATEASRIAACAQAARGLPSEERFPRWRGCVAAARDATSVLPLGRMRAPTSGWLVLRGRRGHYEFCDELRAYDLATGAAYVASRCSRLFGVGGAPSPSDTVVVGRVPLDALREAAWMLLLADSVDAHHHASLRVIVPSEVPLRWDGSRIGASGRGGGWASSAQTRLDWSWVSGARVLTSGTLTWPDSDRAAQNHAASLVRIAEAALAPGCAPVALPRGLALGVDTLGVSAVDADSATLATIGRELETSLRAARAPRCRRE